jgi:hypothetical protein
LLAHDAALRARIAALECENERLKSEMGYHEAKDVIEQLRADNKRLSAIDTMCQKSGCVYRQISEQRDLAINQCNDLTAQFATMTHLKDEALRAWTELTQQLAAKDARIAELLALMDSADRGARGEV